MWGSSGREQLTLCYAYAPNFHQFCCRSFYPSLGKPTQACAPMETGIKIKTTMFNEPKLRMTKMTVKHQC